MDIVFNACFIRDDRGELTEPLDPVERGYRTAEADDADQQEIAGVDEGCHGRPLGDQHSERRQEHSCDTDDHAHGQSRHSDEQTVHILDHSASDVMLRSTYAEEQQRLGDRVEDDQHDACPYRFSRSNTAAGDDQAQVRDGGVSKYSLRVVL